MIIRPESADDFDSIRNLLIAAFAVAYFRLGAIVRAAVVTYGPSYLGVPVTLGAKGVEKVHELKLEKSELEALQKSAGVYKEIIDGLPK